MFRDQHVDRLSDLIEENIKANHAALTEIKANLSEVRRLADETTTSLFGTKSLPGGLSQQVQQSAKDINDLRDGMNAKHLSQEGHINRLIKEIEWAKAVMFAIVAIPTAVGLAQWYFIDRNSESIKRLDPKDQSSIGRVIPRSNTSPAHVLPQ